MIPVEGVREFGSGNGLIIEKWEVNRHSVWNLLSLKKKALFNARPPQKRTTPSLSLSDLDSTFLSSIFSLSLTTSQSLLLHPTLSLHHKISSFPIPP